MRKNPNFFNTNKQQQNQNNFGVQLIDSKQPVKQQQQSSKINSNQKNINNSQNKSNFINERNILPQPNKAIVIKMKTAKRSGLLNLSNMGLSFLPSEIFSDQINYDDLNWWEIVDITKLDATNNNISELNENKVDYDFNGFPGLNYLKFSNNKFNAIPISILNLNMLKFLDFSSNNIMSVDSSIGNLINLVELNLNKNRLTHLPHEFGNLKNLEVLDISENNISDLNLCFIHCGKLKKINASMNKISELKMFYLSHCEEVVVGKNNIARILFYPDSNNLNDCLVFNNVVLKLGGNSNNKNNRVGNSGFNRLKNSGVDRNMSNNNYYSGDVGDRGDKGNTPYTNLIFLDAHNNSLYDLDFPLLPKLDSLVVGYNRITSISNIKNLPLISVLDINNNKLEDFPIEILYTPNLKTLNIQNNSINDIPSLVSCLPNLVRLSIEGNPMRRLNSKLRSSNAEQIKAYLKTRITEEDISLFNKIKEEILNHNINNSNNSTNINSLNQSINNNDINSNKDNTYVSSYNQAFDINNNLNNQSSIKNSNNIPNISDKSRLKPKTNTKMELELDIDIPNQKNTNLGVNYHNYYTNNNLNLKKLDLHTLPEDVMLIRGIEKLSYIDLTNNHFKSLNSCYPLFNLTELSSINVSNNKLTSLIDLENEGVIDAKGRRLDSVSVLTKFLNMKSIKMLELKGNNLSEFLNLSTDNYSNNNSGLINLVKLISPSIIEKEKNEYNFFINNKKSDNNEDDLNHYYNNDTDSNDCSILVSSFLDIHNYSYSILTSLSYLDLSLNRLLCIPNSLKLFYNLKTLLIGNNCISDVSNVFPFNENINYNDIKESLVFKHLSVLDLGTNKITLFPSKMYLMCPSLSSLNLENNDIKMFPTDLCVLALNKLSVSGNPTKQIRMNIIQSGTNSLNDYLTKMHSFNAYEKEFIKGKSNKSNKFDLEKHSNNNNSSIPTYSNTERNKQAEKITSQIKGKIISNRVNVNNNTYTNQEFSSSTNNQMEVENNNINYNNINVNTNTNNNNLPINSNIENEIIAVEKELASDPLMNQAKKLELKRKHRELIKERARLLK